VLPRKDICRYKETVRSSDFLNMIPFEHIDLFLIVVVCLF